MRLTRGNNKQEVIPKKAFVFFPKDHTTMITTTSNITFTTKENSEGTLVWKGKTHLCFVLKMSGKLIIQIFIL